MSEWRPSYSAVPWCAEGIAWSSGAMTYKKERERKGEMRTFALPKRPCEGLALMERRGGEMRRREVDEREEEKRRKDEYNVGFLREVACVLFRPFDLAADRLQRRLPQRQ